MPLIGGQALHTHGTAESATARARARLALRAITGRGRIARWAVSLSDLPQPLRQRGVATKRGICRSVRAWYSAYGG
jgi:hypothetical protein